MHDISKWCSKDKASGFCSGDHIKINALQAFRQFINGKLQCICILQYTCDITENNSLLWEIRDTALLPDIPLNRYSTRLPTERVLLSHGEIARPPVAYKELTQTRQIRNPYIKLSLVNRSLTFRAALLSPTSWPELSLTY